jgi:uncharacterized protein
MIATRTKFLRGRRGGRIRHTAPYSKQVPRLFGIFALLSLTAMGAAGADAAHPPPAVLPLTETYLLHSAASGRDYRISVALPIPAPITATQKLPVIYVLDADEIFGLAADTVRLFTDSGAIPAVLVVGVGYPIRSFEEAMEPRSTDFTPTVDRPYEQLVEELTGGKRRVVTGGAEAFLRFIREELKPFVATHYPADPTEATIVGHSLGGLFGLYVLLQEPDTFKRYLIGSPCLMCGNSDLFKREARYAAAHKDLTAQVYMDVGTEEADLRKILNIPPEMHAAERRYLDATGHPDSVALFRKFVQRLKSRHYPSLRLHTVIEAGEGHESVPPILVSRGLRALYAPRP